MTAQSQADDGMLNLPPVDAFVFDLPTVERDMLDLPPVDSFLFELPPVPEARQPVPQSQTFRFTNYFLQPAGQPAAAESMPSSESFSNMFGTGGADSGANDTPTGLSPFAGFNPTTDGINTGSSGDGTGEFSGTAEVQNVANTLAQGSHTDIASILTESSSVKTVVAQQRSQTSFDPRIRGYHIGQVYAQADGEYWMPVRNDLDSMLGKIDPSLIQSVTVVPGPYAVQYGPGFAFIDVQTADTPRYANGYEAHNRIGIKPTFNGGQLYGYDTVYGGNCNYGYIASYSNRTGSDYLAGNGQRIPSSYHTQSFLGQLGVDLTPDTKLEVRYRRLDQTNTEYALQFFDVDDLETDSFSTTLVTNDVMTGVKTQVDGWYNRTRFNGDSQNPGKRPFPGNPNWHVLDRVDTALANTTGVPTTFVGTVDGDLTSTGGRYMKTIGDQGESQIRIGTDLRYLEQQTFESYSLTYTGTPTTPISNPFGLNQPRGRMIDPGIFTEAVLPSSDEIFTTKIGARLDWVTMDAQATGGLPNGLRSNTSLPGAPGSLPQSNVLYAVYLVEDVAIADHWTGQLGFGNAQRAPTLTERYADGVFISMFQSGFTRVFGNPNLSPEKNYQIDATVKADYDDWHARATFFNSWIVDYVTYQTLRATDPTGARVVFADNTDLATLTGFEVAGDAKVSSALTVFGSMQYVRGIDQTINANLPGIYPLQATVGVRLLDPTRENRYGLEVGERMVAAQHLVGALRVEDFDVTGAVRKVETRTPGFATTYIKGYYNVTPNFNIVAGIDNVFNRAYYEHLSLRLPAGSGYGPNYVFSPGITPYLAVESTY